MFKKYTLLMLPFLLYSAEVGSFNVKRELTSTKLLFPDKVIVHAFDDPKVKGVTCYLSVVETGGVKGAVGLAEDPNQTSIACRQTGEIVMGNIERSKEGEVVFSEKQSLFFKHLKVRRIYDEAKKVILYVAFSERILDGSYETGISAIPLYK
ncbi:MAG: CreA family protein [Sulfurospirillum sp.]|nr:CreA family protein [Sulfurospirillum sp.]